MTCSFTPVTYCQTNNLCVIGTCEEPTGQCAYTDVPNCCSTKENCPQPNDWCKVRTCVNNECGTDLTPECVDDNPCTVDSCVSATSQCIHDPVVCPPTSGTCKEDICDPATGACVTKDIEDCCATDEDCQTEESTDPCMKQVCREEKCVPISLDDEELTWVPVERECSCTSALAEGISHNDAVEDRSANSGGPSLLASIDQFFTSLLRSLFSLFSISRIEEATAQNSWTTLQVTTTADKTYLALGDTVIFTITARNSGYSNAFYVDFSDTLDPSLTITSVAGTNCSFAGQTVTCINQTAALLPNMTTAPVTITAKLRTDNPPVCFSDGLQNTATASADNTPVASDSLDAAIPVKCPTTLQVTKTGPTAAEKGTNITYGITIRNTGAVPARGVALTDILHSIATQAVLTNVIVAIAPPSSCSYSISNRRILCFFDDIAPSAAKTVTISGVIPNDSALCDQSIPNTAEASAINSAQASDALDTPTLVTCGSPVPPTPQTTLLVTKTANRSTIMIGDTVTFTIIAKNTGTNNALNVDISDTIDPSFTITGVTGTNCGTVGQTVTCNNHTASLAPGATTSPVTITARLRTDNPPVCSASPQSLQNMVTASADNVPQVSGSLPAPITATCPTTLTVQKTGPAITEKGTNISYNITITNNGTVPARNISLTDTISTALVNIVVPSGCSFNTSNRQVSCMFTTINPSPATKTITISGTIRDDAALCNTAILNSAYITATNAFPASGTLNPSTQVRCTQAQTTLSATKTADKTSLSTEDQVTFTITAKNTGTNNALNVDISDTLDPSFVVTSVTGVNCSTVGQTVTCNNHAASLAPGATTSPVTITALLRSDNPPVCSANPMSLQNTASVIADNASLVSASLPAALAVSCPTTIAVRKTGPASAEKGTSITYNITITNNGTVPARNISLTDTISTALANITVSPSPECSVAGQNISCSFANIYPARPGNTKTVTISGTIRDDAALVGQSIPNTAVAFAANAPQVSGVMNPATLVTAAVPTAPGSFTIDVLSPTSVLLRWDDAAAETRYEVSQWNVSEGGEAFLAGRLDADVARFFIQNLTPNKQYAFDISACNETACTSAGKQPVTMPSAPGSCPTCEGGKINEDGTCPSCGVCYEKVGEECLLAGKECAVCDWVASNLDEVLLTAGCDEAACETCGPNGCQGCDKQKCKSCVDGTCTSTCKEGEICRDGTCSPCAPCTEPLPDGTCGPLCISPQVCNAKDKTCVCPDLCDLAMKDGQCLPPVSICPQPTCVTRVDEEGRSPATAEYPEGKVCKTRTSEPSPIACGPEGGTGGCPAPLDGKTWVNIPIDVTEPSEEQCNDPAKICMRCGTECPCPENATAVCTENSIAQTGYCPDGVMGSECVSTTKSIPCDECQKCSEVSASSSSDGNASSDESAGSAGSAESAESLLVACVFDEATLGKDCTKDGEPGCCDGSEAGCSAGENTKGECVENADCNTEVGGEETRYCTKGEMIADVKGRKVLIYNAQPSTVAFSIPLIDENTKMRKTFTAIQGISVHADEKTMSGNIDPKETGNPQFTYTHAEGLTGEVFSVTTALPDMGKPKEGCIKLAFVEPSMCPVDGTYHACTDCAPKIDLRENLRGAFPQFPIVEADETIATTCAIVQGINAKAGDQNLSKFGGLVVLTKENKVVGSQANTVSDLDGTMELFSQKQLFDAVEAYTESTPECWEQKTSTESFEVVVIDEAASFCEPGACKAKAEEKVQTQCKREGTLSGTKSTKYQRTCTRIPAVTGDGEGSASSEGGSTSSTASSDGEGATGIEAGGGTDVPAGWTCSAPVAIRESECQTCMPECDAIAGGTVSEEELPVCEDCQTCEQHLCKNPDPAPEGTCEDEGMEEEVLPEEEELLYFEFGEEEVKEESAWYDDDLPFHNLEVGDSCDRVLPWDTAVAADCPECGGACKDEYSYSDGCFNTDDLAEEEWVEVPESGDGTAAEGEAAEPSGGFLSDLVSGVMNFLSDLFGAEDDGTTVGGTGETPETGMAGDIELVPGEDGPEEARTCQLLEDIVPEACPDVKSDTRACAAEKPEFNVKFIDSAEGTCPLSFSLEEAENEPDPAIRLTNLLAVKAAFLSSSPGSSALSTAECKVVFTILLKDIAYAQSQWGLELLKDPLSQHGFIKIQNGFSDSTIEGTLLTTFQIQTTHFDGAERAESVTIRRQNQATGAITSVTADLGTLDGATMAAACSPVPSSPSSMEINKCLANLLILTDILRASGGNVEGINFDAIAWFAPTSDLNISVNLLTKGQSFQDGFALMQNAIAGLEALLSSPPIDPVNFANITNEIVRLKLAMNDRAGAETSLWPLLDPAPDTSFKKSVTAEAYRTMSDLYLQKIWQPNVNADERGAYQLKAWEALSKASELKPDDPTLASKRLAFLDQLLGSMDDLMENREDANYMKISDEILRGVTGFDEVTCGWSEIQKTIKNIVKDWGANITVDDYNVIIENRKYGADHFMQKVGLSIIRRLAVGNVADAGLPEGVCRECVQETCDVAGGNCTTDSLFQFGACTADSCTAASCTKQSPAIDPLLVYSPTLKDLSLLYTGTPNEIKDAIAEGYGLGSCWKEWETMEEGTPEYFKCKIDYEYVFRKYCQLQGIGSQGHGILCNNEILLAAAGGDIGRAHEFAAKVGCPSPGPMDLQEFNTFSGEGYGPYASFTDETEHQLKRMASGFQVALFVGTLGGSFAVRGGEVVAAEMLKQGMSAGFKGGLQRIGQSTLAYAARLETMTMVEAAKGLGWTGVAFGKGLVVGSIEYQIFSHIATQMARGAYREFEISTDNSLLLPEDIGMAVGQVGLFSALISALRTTKPPAPDAVFYKAGADGKPLLDQPIPGIDFNTQERLDDFLADAVSFGSTVEAQGDGYAAVRWTDQEGIVRRTALRRRGTPLPGEYHGIALRQLHDQFLRDQKRKQKEACCEGSVGAKKAQCDHGSFADSVSGSDAYTYNPASYFTRIETHMNTIRDRNTGVTVSDAAYDYAVNQILVDKGFNKLINSTLNKAGIAEGKREDFSQEVALHVIERLKDWKGGVYEEFLLKTIDNGIMRAARELRGKSVICKESLDAGVGDGDITLGKLLDAKQKEGAPIGAQDYLEWINITKDSPFYAKIEKDLGITNEDDWFNWKFIQGSEVPFGKSKIGGVPTNAGDVAIFKNVATKKYAAVLSNGTKVRTIQGKTAFYDPKSNRVFIEQPDISLKQKICNWITIEVNSYMKRSVLFINYRKLKVFHDTSTRMDMIGNISKERMWVQTKCGTYHTANIQFTMDDYIIFQYNNSFRVFYRKRPSGTRNVSSLIEAVKQKQIPNFLYDSKRKRALLVTRIGDSKFAVKTFAIRAEIKLSRERVLITESEDGDISYFAGDNPSRQNHIPAYGSKQVIVGASSVQLLTAEKPSRLFIYDVESASIRFIENENIIGRDYCNNSIVYRDNDGILYITWVQTKPYERNLHKPGGPFAPYTQIYDPTNPAHGVRFQKDNEWRDWDPATNAFITVPFD